VAEAALKRDDPALRSASREVCAMRIAAIELGGSQLKEYELGDDVVLCLPVTLLRRAGEGFVSYEPRELIVPLEQLGLKQPD
jgi:hypothetical protein